LPVVTFHEDEFVIREVALRASWISPLHIRPRIGQRTQFARYRVKPAKSPSLGESYSKYHRPIK